MTMTREEAVNRFKGIRKSFSISIAQSKFYPSKAILDELCGMAIEALQIKSVKHGKWKYYNYSDINNPYVGWYECSVCKQHEHIEHKFCPNCGAKMDGGKE